LQAELERLAQEEEKTSREYLRPIVLFQAQRNEKDRQNVTYDVLKKSLMADFNIPEDQIAIATGSENELADVPILERGQPVRFIITVDKLREGWDCPFAYILCSVSNLSSSTAVEQILGRILRLPHARRKGREELNHAYAFATSQGFVDAANALTEALVESGFERFEAKAMVALETAPLDFGPLFTQQVSEPVSARPAMETLPQELRAKVSVGERAGRVEIVYQGPAMTEAEATAIKAAVATQEDREAVERLCRKSRGEDASPAAMGRKLAVPALAVRIDKQLELFEDQFLEAPWNLAACDPALGEAEFAVKIAPAQVAEVDVDKEGKIGYRFVEELERQLSLLDVRGPKTEQELALWLDREIEHRDITQTDSSLFLRRMIQALISGRDFPLEQLAAHRFRLRDAVREKINGYRAAAHRGTFQRMLLPDAAQPVEVSPEVCFTFPLKQYPAVTLYQGPIRFGKHYYALPAHMNDEEAACAAIIESLPEVEYWVRNLERDRYAFWFPTPTDKFYPDFVALLKDGRYLVVEFKGGHLLGGPDAEEKKMIGDLWEARGKGLCIFRMVGKDDMEHAIPAAVRNPQ